ncbi:hypothetical protein [Bacillus atrophaeus]|uniref:hypothetical protein n=1 Tax=Bacillus atrophaeus TaxID=1452 RepID=UPI002E2332BC|nr:hypothetical protein [Bacillus atrophaeus]
MNTRIFKTLDGPDLIVKSRRSAVIFEIDKNQDTNEYNLIMKFSPEDYKELMKYLEEASNKSWASLIPKEATSFGAEYFEYYDKELDNNGYLWTRENNTLSISRPSLDSTRLYQFNKKKMESFIYDFRKQFK